VQSSLSNWFWVDSFLTTTYLIIRLPTHVLDHGSPYSILFGKTSNYSLMHTFGSLSYPLLRPYVNHKLSFRNKSCIFVGYYANQRGYWCLDSQTQNIYISRSVVFYESKFPAKGFQLSQGSCKVTIPPDNYMVILPPLPIASPTLHQPRALPNSSSLHPTSHSHNGFVPYPNTHHGPPLSLVNTHTSHQIHQSESSPWHDTNPSEELQCDSHSPFPLHTHDP
jgi:hypothetical protein